MRPGMVIMTIKTQLHSDQEMQLQQWERKPSKCMLIICHIVYLFILIFFYAFLKNATSNRTVVIYVIAILVNYCSGVMDKS